MTIEIIGVRFIVIYQMGIRERKYRETGSQYGKRYELRWNDPEKMLEQSNEDRFQE